MRSFSDRLRAALDRRDIPRYIQVQVFNTVCGPEADNPPKVAWKALQAEVQAHIVSLRGNKAKVHATMRALRTEYYDVVVSANKLIRKHPQYEYVPTGRERWQEWVHEEVRLDLSKRMRAEYAQHGIRGNHIVPFAPTKYRNENLERLRRCEVSIAAERTAHDPMEKGRGDTPMKALILCACRQAELAITAYRKALVTGEAHPYENPAKVNWQHYCTPAMRARVRAALKNEGETIFMDDLLTFYASAALVTR
jgi:hypothetical protein